MIPAELGGYNVVGIKEKIFRSSNITSVEIEAPITVIPNEAFYDCQSLTTVVFPNTVKEIHDSAFFECINLKCINIPRTLKHRCYRLMRFILSIELR